MSMPIIAVSGAVRALSTFPGAMQAARRSLASRDLANTMRAGKQQMIETTAMRNSSLQGGYFILAARALGLECGQMSGFDEQKVNAAFINGTSTRVNFVCS